MPPLFACLVKRGGGCGVAAYHEVCGQKTWARTPFLSHAETPPAPGAKYWTWTSVSSSLTGGEHCPCSSLLPRIWEVMLWEAGLQSWRAMEMWLMGVEGSLSSEGCSEMSPNSRFSLWSLCDKPTVTARQSALPLPIYPSTGPIPNPPPRVGLSDLGCALWAGDIIWAQ